MHISIIVPVYNESSIISHCLNSLQPWLEHGHEVIVVDGGSSDLTREISESLVSNVYTTKKGRATQMNVGANLAKGDVLIFLHADTILPEYSSCLLRQLCLGEIGWGYFDIRLTGSRLAYRVIGFMMSLRSRVTGIATGDQAIFLHRRLFEKVGGFPELPIMEDIALCRQLIKYGRPHRLNEYVKTSSRRWEKKGILWTVLLMWYLRASFFLGANPDYLAKIYAR